MTNQSDQPLTFGEFTVFVGDYQKFYRDYQHFRADMSAFKEEMLAFKEEMYEFKDDMLAFKADYQEFKADMLEFKKQTEENFDRLFKMLVEIKTELKAAFSLCQRHDEQLISHDRRLALLES